MPKAKTRPLTKQKSDEKYGGGPSELSKTKSSTYRQLIRCYHHLKNTDPQSSILQYCQQKKKDLMVIWQSVNPQLPFIHDVNRKQDKRFATVGKSYQPKTQ